jgi:hypothetical protein
VSAKEPFSADELVERLAQVSHASYLWQSVNDYDRRLADIRPPDEREIEDSPTRRRDLETVGRWLQAVLGGASLESFSNEPGHHPTDHDRERAHHAMKELERLGLFERPDQLA